MKRMLKRFASLIDPNLLGSNGSNVENSVTQLPAFDKYGKSRNAEFLRQIMSANYTAARLTEMSPQEFESYISSLPGATDWVTEGFTSPSHQRDMSITFEWGHNHDFGSFSMAGRMGDRHINILAAFMEEYNAPKLNLAGMKILDIGCWTGGTSLLLAGMGADVLAIEEVRKYAETVRFLSNAFGIENLRVENRSLYSLDDPQFYDQFDLILYSGVLYHVTDPVLSLRIVFNALKDGGQCLLETMATGDPNSRCVYEGATVTLDREGKSRSGWNWFVPSPEAVRRMMSDVGFSVPKVTFHNGNRVLALGVRGKHVDMLRAGLANPEIR